MHKLRDDNSIIIFPYDGSFDGYLTVDSFQNLWLDGCKDMIRHRLWTYHNNIRTRICGILIRVPRQIHYKTLEVEGLYAV